MLPEVQIVEKLTSKFKVWYIFKAEILGKKKIIEEFCCHKQFLM